jgi:hypothetical protein
MIVILKFWLTDGYMQLSMVLANVCLNGCLVQHLNGKRKPPVTCVISPKLLLKTV